MWTLHHLSTSLPLYFLNIIVASDQFALISEIFITSHLTNFISSDKFCYSCTLRWIKVVTSKHSRAPSSVKRLSDTSLPNYGENNGSFPLNPQPLYVAPICCVPYTGPPLSCDDHASPSPDINAGSVSVEADSTSSSEHVNSQQPAGSRPATIFFTACPAREEWDNLINYANDEVALTGSALLVKVGPLIGSVDIAESEDDYVFRVSLPGVARDEKVFHCDGGPDGKILIKGVSTTGESVVCRDNMVFKMQTQNLCPPGEFCVSFQLPGPIDHHNLNCVFGSDGVFEGVVKKKKTGPLRGS